MVDNIFLTLKQLGHFSLCLILSSDVSRYKHNKCHVFVRNWSNAMPWYLVEALWILMPWCYSTRVSVATVLSTHHAFQVVYGLSYFLEIWSSNECFAKSCLLLLKSQQLMITEGKCFLLGQRSIYLTFFFPGFHRKIYWRNILKLISHLSLVQVMAWCRTLSESMMAYC